MDEINKAYTEFVEKNPKANEKAHFAAGYAAGVAKMTAPHPLPTLVPNPMPGQTLSTDDDVAEDQEEFELVEPKENDPQQENE